MTKSVWSAVALGLATLAAAPSAWADTTITVKLTGESHEKMGAELSQSTVPAGPTDFVVTNAAAKSGHEAVVIRLKQKGETLTVDPATDRVDEKQLQSLGEVSKLKPGQSGTLKVDLTPGDYMVFCNYKGHYTAGMWAPLTVTP
ncbi:plastocyanin/azurin family copper-binding protein [Lichenihabitans sp. Uapishka_5]|uniref:plastocyanin/azurin family copper-binding protein n=1 Tax=Lichenihabitans sp. Uapishka_5 TaxID=3037302 RepID=UPI0029E7F852|nr:plastocyanin/azurin family copper-binding protein [Lichenihabitans sp. Uapishka_5]MDX7953763.1 plastocyanin/azurin family copper-binding protein [Lichenihabitans sp. Uapishka_5]